tara:strand:- start:2724 stop:3887 length:1164 start_codon:yes stop_codon:yes gene_type:complete
MRVLSIFTFLSLLLTSCATDITSDSVFFKANPQEVIKQEVKTLNIGEKAPDFTLPSTDGKYYSLSDFEKDILVIIFTCNHCPTAQAYEERIKDIVNDYKDQSVQVVGISPNSPLGLLYEELGYSDLGDEFDEMILRDEAHAFNFPYLYDGDDQKVSLAYGPVATPHVFIFDKGRILQYVGRIDKSEKPGTANAEDLRVAVDAMLAGGTPELATTKTFGCSTKWGWKTELKTKVDKEWSEKEVKLDDLSKEGLTELISNESSEKLRLINFWASWCGPCRLEYPEFVVIQRMFGARDFEFVSVSLDNADKKRKALEILVKAESALQNYISTVTDKYELIELVDKNWNGALPYTLLIEPGGNVVWSHQGEVDFLELKRAIADHDMIGRVY